MYRFLSALLLALAVLAGPAHARSLLFVSDVDFAPYSMIIDNEPAGIDVEFLVAAAQKTGVDVRIEFKPWKELVRMVSTGECDGAFSLFMTPERQKDTLFLEAAPMHYSDYVLFTKVGDQFDFDSYDQLEGKTIGRVAGTDLGGEFREALDAGKFKLKEYPDLASALRGLLVDEVNAYAGNIDVTYYRLKAMGMTSSITYLPKKLVKQKPAYLVLSKAAKIKDKEVLIQQLEVALDTMRKNGSYNKIARRYLLRY